MEDIGYYVGNSEASPIIDAFRKMEDEAASQYDPALDKFIDDFVAVLVERTGLDWWRSQNSSWVHVQLKDRVPHIWFSDWVRLEQLVSDPAAYTPQFIADFEERVSAV